jgi:hypothetical protein
MCMSEALENALKGGGEADVSAETTRVSAATRFASVGSEVQKDSRDEHRQGYLL